MYINVTMAVERLQSDSARDLVDSVDQFIVDLDGVLWDVKGVIGGSPEALSLLRTKNKKIIFASNNSTFTREEYVTKFESFGYHVKKEDIFNTARSSALYLKTINFRGTVYVVGTASIGKELDELNIKHIGIGPDFEGAENRRETWINTKLDPEVTGVIVGFDTYFSCPKILKAASYLQREESLFIATGEDANFTGANGIIIPDNGGMVEAVKITAKKDPTVVGKPGKLMFDMMNKELHLDPSRCCVVGDSLGTDIALAKASGMKSLLVMSGDTSQDDLDQLTSGESDLPRPDFYTNSLGDLCSLMA